VADAKRRILLGAIRKHTVGSQEFWRALERPTIAVIAEIKKASPFSQTPTVESDRIEPALQYQAGAAHSLSVLTDKKNFQGDETFVQDIQDLTHLPILRKDFVIDEYQVCESRSLGADALSLVVRAHSKVYLRVSCRCAKAIGLGALVETHSEKEIETANIGTHIRDKQSRSYKVRC
jgi:indole-3-glycerol phosphate synthase